MVKSGAAREATGVSWALRSLLRVCAAVVVGGVAAFAASCVSVPPENPGFRLTIDHAGDELAWMREHPRALPRPVIVLGGYRSHPLMAGDLAARLRGLTGEPAGRIIAVSYPDLGDIPSVLRAAYAGIVAAVPEAASGADIDIVGISMGGLIGRALADGLGAAATPEPGGEAWVAPGKLNVRRLFTLATPHRGATLAELIALEPAAEDMKGGSKFLAELDAALPAAGYELVCYGRPRDTWVGATRTAPPGRDPIWASGRLIFTHFTVHQDSRIVADLARRLRGEPGYAEPSPVPRD